MKEADEEARTLRRFLLGELGEDERERVEERFITDPEFRERVLVSEDVLVEDYLADELTEADRELFLGHFLSTPEQRRKVKIAGSLKRYMAAEMRLPSPAPGGEVLPPGANIAAINESTLWYRRSPWAVGLASLAVLCALIFGSLWLAGVQNRRNQRAAIRQDLEQINSQPVSATAPSFLLTPLIVRGAGAPDTVSLRAEGDAVQLWLVLVKEDYQTYQVVFWKNGEQEQFPIDNLHAESSPRGRAVPVRILSRLLSPGTYTIRLNGIDGGRAEEVGGYRFEVTP